MNQASLPASPRPAARHLSLATCLTAATAAASLLLPPAALAMPDPAGYGMPHASSTSTDTGATASHARAGGPASPYASTGNRCFMARATWNTAEGSEPSCATRTTMHGQS